MRRRRVLIVAYFFPPLAGGGVHRVLSFTRHLPRHGWDCTVICAGRGDYWVTDSSLEARVDPATEVIRVEGGSGLAAWLKLRPGSAGRRSGTTFGGLRALSDWALFPDSYAGWGHRAGRRALRRLEAGADVLLTSSPPDSAHLAGLAAKRASSVPWVADFRDPWMGLHFRTPPTAWHRRRHERLERDVLHRSDRVLAASRTHADQLRARFVAEGLDPARVVHLPNGFEPAAEATPTTTPAGAPVTTAAEAPATPRESTASPRGEAFNIAFTGTLSLMPDVEVFLEAVHDLLARLPEARRRLRVRLAGPFDAGYQDRAVALGLTGIVEFTGPVAHAESRALQRGAQLLVHWQPRAFPTMVPGKLYEYFEAGRPIVAALDSATEAAELLRGAGATVVPPGDRAQFGAAIERHYRAWREHGPEPSRSPEWLDEHRRDRLAGRLAQVLDALVAVPA
jgi:glycosyltransferase involved in cell wall biosynthesis